MHHNQSERVHRTKITWNSTSFSSTREYTRSRGLPIKLKFLSSMLSSKPFIICVLHNPPNSKLDYQRCLLSFISDLLQYTRPVVFMGDFNVPDISWFTLEFSSNLCDLIFEYNLTQIVEDPTHVQGHILDLIFTNIEDNISIPEIHSENNPLLSSDHYAVTFNLRLSFSSEVNPAIDTINILVYSKADFESINIYLSHIDFTPCFQSSDVELVWSFIKEILMDSIHQFVPSITIKPNAFPKWFTSNPKHKIKCLHSLRKRYSRSPTPHIKQRIQAVELDIADESLSACSTYESKLIHDFATSNQSKYTKLYQHIRNLTKSSCIPSTMFYECASATNDIYKASLFN